jgi:D-xylose transport system ATP-binding protein
MALLKAEDLSKTFPGVRALDGVSLEVRAGEIHALCGENGAGKSTLIKILSGIHPHGSHGGQLWVDGQPACFGGVADAGRAGIAVICQELALVEEMTVAENIFLGREPLRAGGLVDWPRLQRDASAVLAPFEVAIDPAARVGDLGVGHKQLIEIAKALSRQSRVLILDEPTAALAQHEVEVLMRILRSLRQSGMGCIYISHKLEEVFALADRITVLRDGRAVHSAQSSQLSPAEVIALMVGRPMGETWVPGPKSPRGAVALRVEALGVDDEQGRRRLQDINLEVAAGEIVGLGGLMGAGRTELLMHLFGAWGVRRAGKVWLEGELCVVDNPEQALRSGLALVPEDRRRHGLVLDQSVGFNLSLANLSTLAPKGWLDRAAELKAQQRLVDSLRIKTAGLQVEVGKLSGGNQQKVVIGKMLETQPKVMMLDEPTRGIDIGAKWEVYELIEQLARQGMAVLLVSSELPELLALSDRIVMLREGRVGGCFRRGEADQQQLMRAALADC